MLWGDGCRAAIVAARQPGAGLPEAEFGDRPRRAAGGRGRGGDRAGDAGVPGEERRAGGGRGERPDDPSGAGRANQDRDAVPAEGGSGSVFHTPIQPYRGRKGKPRGEEIWGDTQGWPGDNCGCAAKPAGEPAGRPNLGEGYRIGQPAGRISESLAAATPTTSVDPSHRVKVQVPEA